MIEPVFNMSRDLKAQLCLYTPPWHTNTILMYKFRHCLNPNHLIHHGKSCVHHYITGVAGGDTHNFWQKYRGGKTSKIKWLQFALIVRYYSYFKSFTMLSFYMLCLLDSNCKHKMSGCFIPRHCSSQTLFLTRKIEHWKNGSWIQILDTALFLESTFHENVYILGMKQLYMLLYLFGIAFFFPNLSVK